MDERRRQFEIVYREQAGTVRAFARRRVSEADTDDVVAEVFLAAWRRFGDVPADPLPWLLGIARGVLANRRRGDVRSHALNDRLGRREYVAAAVEQGVSGVDDGVRRALESLSARDQELLLLVAWDGLTRDQIAAMLGISAGHVAVRLHRARARLARALSAQDTGVREMHPRAEELCR